ncbi:DUF7386 family protein [Halorubrum trueperi]
MVPDQDAAGSNPVAPVRSASLAWILSRSPSQNRFASNARDELDPATIQHFNTDVLGLRYRTRVESRWR